MSQAPYTRDEPEATRLDRNWSELVQELRVVGFGVQVLFGFLLGIAFQARFDHLSTAEEVVYLVTLATAAVATGLLIAPVALHRITFGEHIKDELVAATDRLALAGLAALLVTVTGSILLVFERVAGWAAGGAVAGGIAAVLGVLWVVWPERVRARGRR